MAKKYYGNKAFCDHARNKIFSQCLNKDLGWQKKHSPFEYYYIQILSTDVKLTRHMDYLNDWREYYHHNYIYSFFRAIEGTEYKVSIVMMTRKAAGSHMCGMKALVNN